MSGQLTAHEQSTGLLMGARVTVLRFVNTSHRTCFFGGSAPELFGVTASGAATKLPITAETTPWGAPGNLAPRSGGVLRVTTSGPSQCQTTVSSDGAYATARVRFASTLIVTMPFPHALTLPGCGADGNVSSPITCWPTNNNPAYGDAPPACRQTAA